MTVVADRLYISDKEGKLFRVTTVDTPVEEATSDIKKAKVDTGVVDFDKVS